MLEVVIYGYDYSKNAQYLNQITTIIVSLF